MASLAFDTILSEIARPAQLIISTPWMVVRQEHAAVRQSATTRLTTTSFQLRAHLRTARIVAVQLPLAKA